MAAKSNPETLEGLVSCLKDSIFSAVGLLAVVKVKTGVKQEVLGNHQCNVDDLQDELERGISTVDAYYKKLALKDVSLTEKQLTGTLKLISYIACEVREWRS